MKTISKYIIKIINLNSVNIANQKRIRYNLIINIKHDILIIIRLIFLIFTFFRNVINFKRYNEKYSFAGFIFK